MSAIPSPTLLMICVIIDTSVSVCIYVCMYVCTYYMYRGKCPDRCEHARWWANQATHTTLSLSLSLSARGRFYPSLRHRQTHRQTDRHTDRVGAIEAHVVSLSWFFWFFFFLAILCSETRESRDRQRLKGGAGGKWKNSFLLIDRFMGPSSSADLSPASVYLPYLVSKNSDLFFPLLSSPLLFFSFLFTSLLILSDPFFSLLLHFQLWYFFGSVLSTFFSCAHRKPYFLCWLYLNLVSMYRSCWIWTNFNLMSFKNRNDFGVQFSFLVNANQHID